MKWVPIDAVEDSLRAHWITSVNCDKEAGTNYASCSCSIWRGPVRSTLGEAVNDWVAHVLADGLNSRPPKDDPRLPGGNFYPA